ncbi:hypothetical protein GT755_30865 [Herbidospora sp. NEAU-GS84]|uniref:Uncharacterized protein n=1 Tax=Herbidospora solisilvae TaxID=2696284 RepID=A0A7C9J7M3_9ACTN|nr:hypothetical protein [Herbidospora solisilvae]NAS26060.1 hypothetical protein [Herbidospora solisilvae]
MNREEAADRLYALPPAEFTAARNRLVKETGDKEIGKLRKPTVLAWAVNQVVRSHPAEIDELLAVGEELRAAWASGDGDALAALGPRRSAAVAAVSRLVLKAASGRLTSTVELEQTLDAAVVDADAAARVRSGRLAGALSYSGFVPTAVPPSAPARRRPAAPDPSARAEAEAAVDRARDRHAEWAGQLASAVAERDEALDAVAEAERALTEARRRASACEQRYDVVRKEEARARRALTDAEQALRRASTGR